MTKEKQEKIDKLFMEANKKFGKGASQFGNSKIEAFPIFSSTGSLNLDIAFGIMGIPKGRIIELFGAESSGKTTLALVMIANIQKAGGICAFVDAEHALDRLWAMKLGVNVDELIISQPDSGEDALSLTEMYIESDAIDFVAVDSVAALTPLAEIEGEMGDAQMGAQARLMGKGLRKISPKCGKHNCTVLFLNQIRMKIGVMFGSPETTPGGNALKFFSSIRMRISNNGSITDKSDETGQFSKDIKIKVLKNKLAPPFMIAKCKLHTNEVDRVYGFDSYEELVNLAVIDGIINKAGSWYSYKGERLGQGSANVAKFFKENPSIYAEVYNKIIGNIQETQKAVIDSFSQTVRETAEEIVLKKTRKPKEDAIKEGSIIEVKAEKVE